MIIMISFYVSVGKLFIFHFFVPLVFVYDVFDGVHSLGMDNDEVEILDATKLDY